VQITLGNVGIRRVVSVNAIYTWNSGPQEAVLLVALEPGKRPSVDALEERLRKKLAARWPTCAFRSRLADIVSQVLNFGAPTPINVTRVGQQPRGDARLHAEIANELTPIPGLRDVQISQALDYPTLDVQIDRERCGTTRRHHRCRRQVDRGCDVVERASRRRTTGPAPPRAFRTA